MCEVAHYIGTLRPDLIESASGLASSKAQVIKTHHNDTPLVRKLRQAVSSPPHTSIVTFNYYLSICVVLQGRVVEPLAEFHKDEVRLLGESLGLPHRLVHRHPFPGISVSPHCVCVLDQCRAWTGHQSVVSDRGSH